MKKVISVCLVLFLLAGLIPASAFSVYAEKQETSSDTEIIQSDDSTSDFNDSSDNMIYDSGTADSADENLKNAESEEAGNDSDLSTESDTGISGGSSSASSSSAPSGSDEEKPGSSVKNQDSDKMDPANEEDGPPTGDALTPGIDYTESEIFYADGSSSDVPQDGTRYTVLVLDCSGSMSGTPMTTLKSAAIKFCSSMFAASGTNYIAMVTYSDSAKTVCTFTADENTINNSINSMSASGGTNAYQGLVLAGQLIDTVPASATKNIVFMSDGLPNEGSYSSSGPYTSSDSSYYKYGNALYTEASGLMEDCNMYSLGFFHNLSGTQLTFGQRLMSDIQNKGYYNVTDASELEFTFGEISQDILDDQAEKKYIDEHLDFIDSSDYSDYILEGYEDNMKSILSDINSDSSVNGFNGLKATNKILNLESPLSDDEEYYEFLILQVMLNDESVTGLKSSFKSHLADELLKVLEGMVGYYSSIIDAGDAVDTVREMQNLETALSKTSVWSEEGQSLYKQIMDKAETLPNEEGFLEWFLGYTKENNLEAMKCLDSFGNYLFLHLITDTISTVQDVVTMLSYGAAYMDVSEDYIEVLRRVLVNATLYGDPALYSSDWYPELDGVSAFFGSAEFLTALQNVMVSMTQYKEEGAFSLGWSIVNDHAGEAVIDIGKEVGTSLVGFFFSNIPVVRLLAVGKSVLQVAELVMSLSDVQDFEYNGDMTKKLYVLSVNFGSVTHDLADELKSKQDFQSAALFDESVNLYRACQLMASTFASNYAESKLNSEINHVILNFDRQEKILWYSLEVTMAELVKQIYSNLQCHSDDVFYDHRTKTLTYDTSKMKVINIACPVDVTIRDSSGNQVAVLTDTGAEVTAGYEPYYQVVEESSSGTSSSSGSEDYMKIAVVPEDYTVSVSGNAAGTMNVLVGSMIDNEITDAQLFSDITVSAGDEFTLTENKTDSEKYDLTSDSVTYEYNTGTTTCITVDQSIYTVAAGQNLYVDSKIELPCTYEEGSHNYIGYFACYTMGAWTQLASWYIDGGITYRTSFCGIGSSMTPGTYIFTVSVFPADNFATGGSLYDKFFRVNVVASSSELTLDAMGGTFDEDSYDADTWTADSDTAQPATLKKSVSYNTEYGTLPEPTREGYQFAGWYTGKSGTGTEITADSTFTSTADQTLYALWQQPAVRITSQPSDSKVKIGDQTEYVLTAKNAVSYQWYCSTTGTSWVKLKDGSTMSGTKTADLSFKMTSGRNRYQYRCAAKGISGETVYSDVVQNARLSITNQPESQEISSGKNATLSCAAENASSYQWYYKKQGETSWHKLSDNTASGSFISGALTSSMTFRVTSTRQTFRYRCRIMGTDGTTQYTNIVTVAPKPSVITQPKSVSVSKNSKVTLSVKAADTKTYQWQYLKAGETEWSKLYDGTSVAGATTDTVTFTATSTRMGFTYRCKLTGSDGTVVYTDEVTIK